MSAIEKRRAWGAQQGRRPFAFLTTHTTFAQQKHNPLKTLDTNSVPAGQLPAASLYDFSFDAATGRWRSWASQVGPYVPPPDGAFAKILVPTADTVRARWLLEATAGGGRACLFVGDTGTAKTATIAAFLGALDPAKWASLALGFSSRTSSADVQRAVEDGVEKRGRDTYGPPPGKRLVLFVDDLNMPRADAYGTQQPVALLRQLAGRGGFYGRGKDLAWRSLRGVQLLAAMGAPGGARGEVDPRFLSLLNVFEIEAPSEASLRAIYSTVLGAHAPTMPAAVRAAFADGAALAEATLELYAHVGTRLPATPARFHYAFNLRDLSRVAEGLLRATPERCALCLCFWRGEGQVGFLNQRGSFTHRSLLPAPPPLPASLLAFPSPSSPSPYRHSFPDPASMLRLWRNEALRVFHDRMVDDADRGVVTAKIAAIIVARWPECAEAALANPLVIGDYGGLAAALAPAVQREGGGSSDGDGGGGDGGGSKGAEELAAAEPSAASAGGEVTAAAGGTAAAPAAAAAAAAAPLAQRPYGDLGGYAAARPAFEALLAARRARAPHAPQLVLFDDALEHLTRACRTLALPRGHCLLVGVGGSGKRSLARLAAAAVGAQVFEIELTRAYDMAAFRDDVKRLYALLGVEDRRVVFLFADGHVADEGFLEVVNNMLTSGEGYGDGSGGGVVEWWSGGVVEGWSDGSGGGVECLREGVGVQLQGEQPGNDNNDLCTTATPSTQTTQHTKPLPHKGVVPSLFDDAEKDALVAAVRDAALAAGVDDARPALWRFFADRCRANLRVALAMSPAGEALRTRCR